jgi:hypothetical protein
MYNLVNQITNGIIDTLIINYINPGLDFLIEEFIYNLIDKIDLLAAQ